MAWTEPDAVTDALRRRWKRGELLLAHAAGAAWEPFSVRISGPAAADVTRDLDAVRSWVARWDKATGPGRPIRLERQVVGGRHSGRNELPARAWIDSSAAAWRVLGVGPQVARWDQLVGEADDPRIAAWMRAHPMKVLAAQERWSPIVAASRWIEAQQTASYVRHIDAPGVDTKFVEANRALIGELLDQLLPPERIDASATSAQFERRYGFVRKPELVRLRTLDPRQRFGPFSELSVRVNEAAGSPPAHSRVLIVENEISFLALPDLADTVAIFGAGYRVRALRDLRWLADREVVYWGDLDTHGFAILDGLRAAFGAVRSILMDRATLLGHRDHWTVEPSPQRTALDRLNSAEAEAYADLVEQVHGPAVRLEQERVRFGQVVEALRHAPDF